MPPLLRPVLRSVGWACLAAAAAGAGFAADRLAARLVSTPASGKQDRFAPPAEDHPRPRGGVLAVVAIAVLAGSGLLAWKGIQQTRQTAAVARVLTHGEPDAGPALIQRYGCAGCHTIPGIPGADGQVAPPLQDLRKRVYIAGSARNGGEALVRFIVDPTSLVPNSAMPATGISEQEARDVAAWLYAQ
jgi:cytochrome c2